jgi:hypothetical protein
MHARKANVPPGSPRPRSRIFHAPWRPPRRERTALPFVRTS